MDKNSIAEKITEHAENIVKRAGFELVHVEVVGTPRNLTVRIFIDKPGGISIEDCSEISRQVGKVLDEEDLIPSAYLLEVSSPGLERELYSLKDFEKFTGQKAKVKIVEAIDGQKNFRGKIVSVNDGTIVFEDITNGLVNIPYQIVKKANLEIDFEEEFKKAK